MAAAPCQAFSGVVGSSFRVPMKWQRQVPSSTGRRRFTDSRSGSTRWGARAVAGHQA